MLGDTGTTIYCRALGIYLLVSREFQKAHFALIQSYFDPCLNSDHIVELSLDFLDSSNQRACLIHTWFAVKNGHDFVADVLHNAPAECLDILSHDFAKQVDTSNPRFRVGLMIDLEFR